MKKLSACNFFIQPNYNKLAKNVFYYLPWMRTHGDKLIGKINISKKYSIKPLKLINNHNEKNRKKISIFSIKYPDKYRSILLNHLNDLKFHIKGMIVTFDWHPSMRILVNVCKELNIPTYLIPHESIFLDEKKYYWYEKTNIFMPICDNLLVWGKLQKKIFIERGVNSSKIQVVGSPKLDKYNNYKSSLTREQFYRLYKLNSSKKTILMVLQPMDVQINQKYGLKKQKKIIKDLFSICKKNNYQLILREPPAPIRTLSILDKLFVYKNNWVALDRSNKYFSTTEEAIYHTDICLSINSTMLFEAILMNKPAITAKYFDFKQLWENINLPKARNSNELNQLINKYIGNRNYPDCIDLSWAENNLSIGEFDGESAKRIKNILENDIEKEINLPVSNNSSYFFDDYVEKTAISNSKIVETVGRYLPTILNTKGLVSPRNVIEASVCDRYIQWGITPNKRKEKTKNLMKKFGKKPYIIEDGFIRSIGIGLTGEPTLSITLCGNTAYYDAYDTSNFELFLNSDKEIDKDDINRAINVIDLIKKYKISKYNDSPKSLSNIGNNKSKVLVVDQRYGDQSVSSSMANENTFNQMLIDAIINHPDSDIIIKRHPDAVKGGKGSYYSDTNIEFIRDLPNVFIIDYDVHPHTLLDLCQKVYVVSSGLGMEALLYNKEVYCYGAPFYSNWGLTHDQIHLGRRQKVRCIEEVFYVSYILYSKYYSPILNRECSIEECIEYVISKR